MDAGEPFEESSRATENACEWAFLAALLTITATITWYVLRGSDNTELPPGPKGVPILGYIPFLGRNHHLKFAELAKDYGPIVRVKFGMVNVVVLNDYASVKKWLSHSAFQSRIRNVFCITSGLLGISSLNGDAWWENRRLCIGILRNNGWKQAVMEEHTKEELQYLCSKLAEYNGQPLPIKKYAQASCENAIMKLLLSVSYPFEDPRRMFLDRCISQVGQHIASSSPVAWTPSWLHTIAGYLPCSRVHSFRSGLRGIVGFVNERIREHQEVLDEYSNLDFTDAYLKETREYRKVSNSHISVEYAAGHLLVLMSAGTIPVSNSIVWYLLNCADKPSLQNRIREEIDTVIGRQRAPAWEDRYRMPFTMACIWETYRWRTINPIGLPRGCEEDTRIGNYVIPKGTVVLPNLWAVHMNPKVWKDPEVFNPSRFLKGDGSGLIAKPKHFVPFSTGKRMCPGQAAANIQIFLYLTGILQKFHVMPEDGVAVDLSSDCVTMNSPKAQKLRFVPRT
ncbi:cytochrome P450 2C44 [Ixodes scapularis]|uniref:cytochrome P450 2C44 n=1 Tax=Ixodes scapularis TaxID=6945 RepID=UPI001A9FF92A|nr:cytochrome P450 2C44 [Ixodes scapularis]